MKQNILLVILFICLSLQAIANAPTTDAITSLTGNSAVCGGADPTASAWLDNVGICWVAGGGTPVITDSKNQITYPASTNAGGAVTFHNLAITGLTCGTAYKVRAYTTSNGTTTYGAVVSFTTSALNVTTNAITSITTSTATTGGTMCGFTGPVTEKGVCWNTTGTPVITDSKLANGATTVAAFTSNITGLSNYTTYYLRAYVTKSGVTTYGPQVTFKTTFVGTTPLAISPEWRFGNNTGLKFSGGVATPQGAITGVSTTGNVEASTSVCDTNGNVVVFTDSRTVYSTISGDFAAPLLRNIEGLDNIASGSSTQGCIGFPDPSSPFDTYYLFTANDFSGGSKEYKGINYYKFKLIGGVMKRIVGPKSLIGDGGTTGVVDESLMAVPDGAGNYWLASHSQSTAEFYIWKIGTDTTRATIVGSLTKYLATGTVAPAGKSAQSSVRFNSCVNKIAWGRADQVRVHNFNQTTGAVTLAPSYSNPGGADFTSGRTTYQVEFSQNGNMLYVTGYQFGADQLTLIDLNGTNGNWVALDTREMWGLQLGPNGNIYAAGGNIGSTNYYEITNSNTTSPTVTQKNLLAGTSTWRGIETLPLVGNVVNTKAGGKLKKSPTNCRDYMFGFRYYNYFNETITISSAVWTFTQKVSPFTVTTVSAPFPYTDSINYVLPTQDAYDVYVTTVDLFCGGTRQSATFTVTPNCSLPVEFINVSAVSQAGSTKVYWSTGVELNSLNFSVQRSLNSRDFTTIGTVTAAGNSKQIKNYSFTDENPIDGIVYYRVIENDKNGEQIFSTIVSTESQSDGKIFTISNNPFKNEFVLNVIGEKNILVDIFEASGKQVYGNKIDGASGSISFGSDLNPGAYILEVLDETTGKVFRDKLLKY